MNKQDFISVIESNLIEYKNMDILDYIVADMKLSLRSMGKLDKTDIQVSGRYKTLSSVTEKIDRKGYTDPNQITDLIGAKIVCRSENQVEVIKELLQEKYKVHELDDYYKNERPDGYKSLHMICEVDAGIKCEFQIKDVKNEVKQKYCHDRIYKNPLISAEIKESVNKNVNIHIDEYLQGKDIAVDYKLTDREIEGFDKYVSKCAELHKQQKQKYTFQQKMEKAKQKAEKINRGLRGKEKGIVRSKGGR